MPNVWDCTRKNIIEYEVQTNEKIRKTLENTKRATTFVDNNEINARLEFAKLLQKRSYFKNLKHQIKD